MTRWAASLGKTKGRAARTRPSLRSLLSRSIVPLALIEGDAPVAAAGADEVRGVALAAGSRPLRHQREGAERAGEVDRAVGAVRGDDALRRLAVLDPVLERGQHVERVGAGPAAAVIHAGHHEQAVEVLRLAERGPRADDLRLGADHAQEVVDAVLRRDVGIAEAVILDELGAAIL